MTIKESFKHFLTVCKYVFSDSWKIVKLNKCNYCVGCCSVSTVFITCCLLISVLSTTPLIYFELAQRNYGQMDMKLTSPFGKQLNYSKVIQHTQNASPRWESYVEIYSNECHKQFVEKNVKKSEQYNFDHFEKFEKYDNIEKLNENESYENNDNNNIQNNNNDNRNHRNNNNNKMNRKDTQNEYRWIYYGNETNPHENCEMSQCFVKYCSNYPRIGTSLIFTDNEQEKRIGLGDKWKYDKLNGNEIYLSESIANDLKISIDDVVFLKIPVSSFNTILKDFLAKYDKQTKQRVERELSEGFVFKRQDI